ncbi:MAG TPA: hypothetical protein VGJ18_09100 [Gemmatimonadaceae bacterium]
MGNFYTNIVLRDDDVDAVATTLDGMKRRSYVASAATATIVFDEASDNQGLGEIERLAALLSRQHGRSERRADVAALLRRRHAEVGLEIDRHLDLCRLLDLPTESVGLGYTCRAGRIRERDRRSQSCRRRAGAGR